jgi:CheY-like chemotaxis protein
MVEDSDSVARSLKNIIEVSTGFEASVANTFAEAREFLDKEGVFEAAVVDLSLPDAPGGEAVDLAVSRGLPVVVFSASFSEGLRETVFSKGVVDYVLKSDPRAMEHITSMLERLWKNREVTALVVDDSRSARSALAGLLRRCRFNVLEAENGKRALKVIEENPDVKLAVLDYNMPGMDGVELTRLLRKTYEAHELAVVGLSMYGNRVVSAAFLKAGANDFLVKPYLEEELLCRINQNVEMLEMSRRMREAKEMCDGFIGTLAHDLRSPLGAMREMAAMLKEDLEGKAGPEALELLDILRRQAADMLSMTDDALDVSLIESGNLRLSPERTAAAGLLEDVARPREIMARGKDVSVIIDEVGVGDLTADPRRMRQALANVVDNAVKYSPHGSKVRIRAVEEDGYAVFEVTDQGPGIGPKELERLFTPYATAGSKPTGGETSTGLGLAIARKIVEAHDGMISVDDGPGQGSTFRIAVPLSV